MSQSYINHGRCCVLFIENNSIKDNDEFIPLIVQTLREYADICERKHAGHEGVEKYFSPNGNRLITVTSTWYGTLLPDL